MKSITLFIALLSYFVVMQAQAAEECPVHRLTVSEINTKTPDAVRKGT